MLKIKNLSVSYENRSVLKNFNLNVNKGEFIIVTGQNGSGKSTLFKTIAGEVFSDAGTILLDQDDITQIPSYIRAKDIAQVLQDPSQGTIGTMSIAENLSFALKRGQSRLLWPFSKKDFFKEKLAVLEMGLENRLDDTVCDLSGGQRQALSLVMATLVPCKILLLDEITAALDKDMSKRLMAITMNLVSKFQYTTLMITHDPMHIEKYGHRTIALS